MRAWRFSSVRSASGAASALAGPGAESRGLGARAGERIGERCGIGVHDRLDRQVVNVDAERCRQRAGVALRGVGGVGGGHDRGGHPVRAERVDRQAGDERGVDPARQAQHDVAEGVLVDVVAQPEGQGRIHLGLERLDHLVKRALCPRAGLEVADQQILLELPGARDRLAGGIEDEGVAVEYEFILTADEPAERYVDAVLSRALGKQLFPFGALTGLVWRCRDVDDQPRARRGLGGGGRAGHPEVLAHRQTDALGADVDHRRLIARREVALFVEHAVVGQVDLAVGRPDSPVGEDRRRVVQPPGRRLGKADECGDTSHLLRQLIERSAHVAQEALAQQQVLGGIAGECELAEQDQLGAGVARGEHAVAYALRVARDVADRGVHLAERQAHLSECRLAWGAARSWAFRRPQPAAARAGERRTAAGRQGCSEVSKALGGR